MVTKSFWSDIGVVSWVHEPHVECWTGLCALKISSALNLASEVSLFCLQYGAFIGHGGEIKCVKLEAVFSGFQELSQNAGINSGNQLVAYLVLFKFRTSLHIFKHQIVHLDKELSVKFAKKKDSSNSTEPEALFSNKDQKQGKSNSPLNTSKKFKRGFHNTKQEANHSSNSYWYLHPEKSPDWWRESQAQWKAGK
ncbi:hypothetical protein VP01_4192g1 [Puccinia sorghi]|uniref:Uncharacterized protein n=1 Tax=Puccinia sorghi TaxID=27349 RepID=A0A0L6URP0_9BASI|nr:hypothetical protein VP01_4192g1 [Puccinia sorghi]